MKLFIIYLSLIIEAQGIFLNCNFVTYTVDGYNCKVDDLKIDVHNTQITVKGQHVPGKRNWNVSVTKYLNNSMIMSFRLCISFNRSTFSISQQRPA